MTKILNLTEAQAVIRIYLSYQAENFIMENDEAQKDVIQSITMICINVTHEKGVFDYTEAEGIKAEIRQWGHLNELRFLLRKV